MSGLIPFYSYDGSYLDHITVKRAARLENIGVAKVVRQKKRHINRVILLRGKDDPRPTTPRDYLGKRYSFQQHLNDGQRPWKLRPLQGGRSETDLAPEELRPIFIRVLLDCLAPAV